MTPQEHTPGERLLRRVAPHDVALVRRSPVDPDAMRDAAPIVEDVRTRGEPALRDCAQRLGDLEPGAPLTLGPDAMRDAYESLAPDDRDALDGAARDIRAFADAQRAAVNDAEVPIPGGLAGHRLLPVERAGCYAPGGRYPLPSSVLMTAITARAAGVRTVWVASPRPAPATLAAAHLARADGVLCAGGAQAIAALAYGAGPVPACDAVVGPGNRWVTAAKQLVSGVVAIDMLAGPSEVLIIADDTADPGTIAADMLAQAEHDPDASAVLVTTSAALIDATERELREQLADLATADTARRALENAFAVLVADLDDAADIADRLAPEHLQVVCRGAPEIARRLRHYGALFVGEGAAEVVGDYGAGPNHVLPTGGTARSFAGLSVLTFLRARTWMRIDGRAPRSLYERTARLARVEGLEAHARAAERRR